MLFATSLPWFELWFCLLSSEVQGSTLHVCAGTFLAYMETTQNLLYSYFIRAFRPKHVSPEHASLLAKDRFGESSSAWLMRRFRRRHSISSSQDMARPEWVLGPSSRATTKSTHLYKKCHQALAAVACLTQLRAGSHEPEVVFVQSVWISRQRLVRQISHENCPHLNLVPTRR